MSNRLDLTWIKFGWNYLNRMILPNGWMIYRIWASKILKLNLKENSKSKFSISHEMAKICNPNSSIKNSWWYQLQKKSRLSHWLKRFLVALIKKCCYRLASSHTLRVMKYRKKHAKRSFTNLVKVVCSWWPISGDSWHFRVFFGEIRKNGELLAFLDSFGRQIRWLELAWKQPRSVGL